MNIQQIMFQECTPVSHGFETLSGNLSQIYVMLMSTISGLAAANSDSIMMRHSEDTRRNSER